MMPPIEGFAKPKNCGECGEIADCGGMEGQLSLEGGCFGHCGPLCLASGCDLACPYNTEDYVWKYMEVGGPNYWPPLDLKSPEPGMPKYIPVVRHGFGREKEFGGLEGYVALTLYDILNYSGLLRGGASTRGGDPGAQLRARFKLGKDTKILVVSTGFDGKLEAFSANYTRDGVGALLSSLGIVGMTPPNYSFFRSTSRSPIPRTDVRWNFRRILRACEDLSDAGIAVIPHLNAQTAKDWKDWARFLRERPQMHYVAKEFQTGLKRQKSAAAALENLERLQDDIGRELHPILIGGVQYADRISQKFERFTFVNSDPFMRTMHRRVIDLTNDISPKWIRRLTEAGHPMDDALRLNVAHYYERIRGRWIPAAPPADFGSFYRRASELGWRDKHLRDNYERFRRGLPPLDVAPVVIASPQIVISDPLPGLNAEGGTDAPPGGAQVPTN